jgi:exopolysaccharide biosynthesis polyprenyl glycosylphosphotransferase
VRDGARFEAAPRRRSRSGLERRLTFTADAAMLLLATAVAPGIGSLGGAADSRGWFAVSAIALLVALAVTGAYALDAREPLADVARRIVSVPALVVLSVCTLRLIAGESPTTEGLIVTWLVCTGALVCSRASGRLLLKTKALRSAIDQRVLIVGAGDVGRLVAKRLLDRPSLGLVPIGYLDKQPRAAHASNLPVLGASWDLEEVIREHDVDAVIVTFSTAPHRVLLDVIQRCWNANVGVMMVPRLFEAESTRATVTHLGGLPIVGVVGPDTDGWQLRIKYGFDRLMALVFIVVTAPLWLIIAAAILITMGRPILYRQRRVGCDGHVFAMFKFRTMRGSPETDGEADEDWAASILGPVRVAELPEKADRRTRLGTFLRAWSLDELPQMLNVLYGEMSLVGPRPERVHYVERFSDVVYRYADRHRVRSGVTGWAQVHGLRGKTSLVDRVEWDNYYIENWSLWLDLKILALSLRAVARTREYDG